MSILNKNDKIAIVACSNGQPIANKFKIDNLLELLKKLSLNPICSN